ncbi:hypothetical protein AB0J52_00310 [Spirillospora sp. NPDC049652]
MIIPLRDAHGLPDLSRLAEWPATCDTCPASTTVARIAPWFVGRRDGTLCPSCWHAESDRLIHQALRPDGVRGVLNELGYLPVRASHLGRRLLTRTRRRIARLLDGLIPGRAQAAA